MRITPATLLCLMFVSREQIIGPGRTARGAGSRKRWQNIVVVHTPIQASWLNQIEIYFSVVQRKVLTPNDFASLVELKEHLLSFQQRYSAAARLFEWKFTREDLTKLLVKLKADATLTAPARRAA